MRPPHELVSMNKSLLFLMLDLFPRYSMTLLGVNRVRRRLPAGLITSGCSSSLLWGVCMARFTRSVFSSGVPGRLRPFCGSVGVFFRVLGTSTGFPSAVGFEEIAYIVFRRWFLIDRGVCGKGTTAIGTADSGSILTYELLTELVSSFSEKRDRRGLGLASCTNDAIFFPVVSSSSLRLLVIAGEAFKPIGVPFGVTAGEDTELRRRPFSPNGCIPLNLY